MIFSNLTRALAIGIASFSLLSFSHADTVILKDGTELEGKITEETPEFVKIIVQVTASIKEPKIIQRTNIKQVVKLSADEIAFAKLDGVLPTGDLLGTADYDRIINTKVQPFIKQFAASPELPKAQAMLKTLEEEKAKVADGAVKLDGAWITAEQIEADSYNHQSKILASAMKKKIAAGDFTEALTDFEKLQTTYGDSVGLAGSIDAAKKAIGGLDAKLKGMKRDSDFKVKQREQQLAGMQAAARVTTENAFQRQMTAYQKGRTAAKEAGQTWLPISIWDPVSIEEAMKTVEGKSAGIQALDAATETKKAAAMEQLVIALNEKNWSKAVAQSQLAREAGAESVKFKELSDLAKESKSNAMALAKAEADKAEAERLAKVRMEREKEIEERDAAEKKAKEAAEAQRKADKAKVAAAEGGEESDDDDESSEDGEGAGEEKKGGLPLPLIIGIVAIMAAVSVFMIKNNKSRAEDDLDSDAGDDAA